MDDQVSKDEKKGYKVKFKKNSSAHSWKLPLFCPVEQCRQVTSNLDDPYLREFACCQTCFINYIEHRQIPLIDVQFYKKQLKERGY